MELRKLNLRDAYEEWEYTNALPEDENGFTNPHHGVDWETYREEVLPALMSHEHPVGMPDWFVPGTYYYLWDEGHIVGEFRIRHYLTDALKAGAGHIGYSIRKEYRNQGYGTKGLALTLSVARQIVPEDEIYLRLLKTNIASRRVMEKNGARCVGEDDEHLFMRIKKETEGAEDGDLRRYL